MDYGSDEKTQTDAAKFVLFKSSARLWVVTVKFQCIGTSVNGLLKVVCIYSSEVAVGTLLLTIYKIGTAWPVSVLQEQSAYPHPSTSTGSDWALLGLFWVQWHWFFITSQISTVAKPSFPFSYT